jgi:3',5'-cyclic AMP phosphodiesterase CpdA
VGEGPQPVWAYRKHFDSELEPVFRDDELLVVGVNTAFQWTIDHGRVTRRHLRDAVERFRKESEGRIKVLVAHHHFIPPPRFERQRVIRNAYKAIEAFSGVGVDLILSGHKHQSYIANSEEFYPSGGDRSLWDDDFQPRPGCGAREEHLQLGAGRR